MAKRTFARWTDEEDARLAALYPRARLSEIETALPSHTICAIRTRAAALGVRCETRMNRVGFDATPPDERNGVIGRVCKACAVWKPAAKYAKSRTNISGITGKCVACTGKRAYELHRVSRIARSAKYSKAHPEYMRAVQGRRRERMKAKTPATAAQIRDLFTMWEHSCGYCGAHADTLDHIRPLSRGGAHEIGNLVPACRPCNLSKHAKTPAEWLNNSKGA